MMKMNRVLQRPLLLVFVIFVSLTTAVWLSVAALPPSAQEWIRISGSQPTYTLADLERSSEAIALVEFQATDRVFWNSRSNQRWQPTIATGKLALIYRDDRFRVVETLKGTLPSNLVVRGIGGQVGNVHMDYEGQVDWAKGGQYLLFLRQDDTPFDVGSERLWTVVWTGSGSFTQHGDRWINADSILDLTVADIQQTLD